MLRARYDSHGNIILGSIVTDAPARTHAVEPIEQKKQRTWTLLEETRREVQSIKNIEPLREEPKKPSILHSVGTQAKNIVKKSVEESAKQMLVTATGATKSVENARTTLRSVPQKITAAATSFWRVAKTPVRLTPRKPGKKPPKKITLFVIDTVRFGGTFAVIFATLFVGINYQSFWQIARAELALGSDITTEQALSDITDGSKAAKAYGALQSSGEENILKYLPTVGPNEDRLIIPKLGKNVPIVRPSMEALMKEDWKKFEEDIQIALHDGVVHYPGSARPGQAGNFFLTGHSSYYPWDDGRYKDVFARLGELDIGDTYSVYYGGDKHTYRITKKYEVKPSDVSVLDQPTTQRTATLMTCTPVGTTLRRLIVQAEEIDPGSGEPLKVGERMTEKIENPYMRLDALPI